MALGSTRHRHREELGPAHQIITAGSGLGRLNLRGAGTLAESELTAKEVAQIATSRVLHCVMGCMLEMNAKNETRNGVPEERVGM